MGKFDILKCKYLGQGRNRIVYLLPSGKNVIKIPINEYGLYNNWDEATIFSRREDGCYIPLARCKMVKDTPYLIMEYVEQTKDPYVEPWTYSVDCSQVGYTRSGKLVAYDYAY